MNPNLTIPDQKASEPRRRDASLLARARTGDKEALGELYEATYPEVWRTVRSLIRDEEDCLDVLQDTYDRRPLDVASLSPAVLLARGRRNGLGGQHRTCQLR